MIRRATRIRMAATLLLACAISACGGEGARNNADSQGNEGGNAAATAAPGTGSSATGEPAESGAAGQDVCRLLTAQEASEILGFPLGEGTPSDNGCAYELVPPSMTGLVLAQLEGETGWGVAVGPDWEQVPGIGDKAAFMEGGMAVKKGERVVVISLINPKPELKSKEPLTKIAQKVAARM